MKFHLKSKGVWYTIENTIPSAPEVDAERPLLEAYDKWQEDSLKAFDIIVSRCDDSQLIYMKQKENAHDVWMALREQHHHTSVGSRVRIYKRLCTHRMDHGASMQKHIDEMFEMFDQLSELDAALDNVVAVGMLLASLNDEYDGLITAMEAWDEQRITLTNVKAKLMDEWQKRSDIGQGSARFSNVQTQRRAHIFTCFECGKPGHIKRNCPEMMKKNMPDLRYALEENKGHAKVARLSKWYSKRFIGAGEEKSQWCVDSGATHHMCADENSFTELDKNRSDGKITTASGYQMKVCGRGKVKLRIRDENTVMTVELSEVLWIPELECPLISVHKLVSDGKVVEFKQNQCQLKCGKEMMNIARFDGIMYRLNSLNESACGKANGRAAATHKELCIHDWHRRLAHRNLNAIKLMTKEGLKIRTCECSDICEACVVGKISRRPFPKHATPTQNTLDVVVSDVCGNMQERSLGGSRYFITFIDIHSGYVEVKFLATKGQAAQASIDFIAYVKTQLNSKPKVFRTDRGMEYLNNTLQSFLRKEGIQSQCTVGYAPEQNGVAERMNRTLVEAARTMMKAANLPVTLWAEAVHTAVYVFNRMVSEKKRKTPYEIFFGKKPRKEVFYEFGCEAYVMVPYEKRQKLDDKAEKRIFVGYDEGAKGYRFIEKKQNNGSRVKVTISREVVFLEDDKPKKDWNSTEEMNEEEEKLDNDDDEELEEEEQDEVFEDPVGEIEPEVNEDVVQQVEEEHEQVEMPRRSTRSNIKQTPVKMKDYVLYQANADDDEDFEPKNYQEAVESKDSERWIAAMDDELRSIDENETWELTDLPVGRKAVGSKWVFKIKIGEKERRFKARCVAQGFSQKFGVDYNEVFAPVAKGVTFRTLMAVAGVRRLSVRHYDIKTAFLNGRLNEEIYLKQPPGFEKNEQVYRLKKSLYGLKQAAHVWNETLNASLVKNGCTQSKEDQCLYTFGCGNDVGYILVHVDDMLVASRQENQIKKLMQKVGEDFELKDLGEVKNYLGIEVTKQDDGSFLIAQSKYIDQIIKGAGLEDGKVSKFPMDTGYHKLEGDELPTNDEYRKLIGMLLYLSTNTRPDISASISILSQRVIKPRDVDLNELKRVVRYLKGTRELKLRLSSIDQSENLFAYSDSDWAENRVDRKSNSGFFCSVYGGATAWSCKKQSVVALSSTEAEYVALTETCREVVWLKRIAKEFNITMPKSATINTDSQSCIALIENHRTGGRTKHMDTKYHYIKDVVRSGEVTLKYHPTETNIADLMTKPLGGTKIEALRGLAGLTHNNMN